MTTITKLTWKSLACGAGEAINCKYRLLRWTKNYIFKFEETKLSINMFFFLVKNLYKYVFIAMHKYVFPSTCKKARGFSPWSPTRALSWTHLKLTVPREPHLVSNAVVSTNCAFFDVLFLTHLTCKLLLPLLFWHLLNIWTIFNTI